MPGSLTKSRLGWIVLGGLVGSAVLAGLILLRLSAGPIRLAFLDRPIATAVSGLVPELTAEVGETALARSGRGVALRVANVRLRRSDGTQVLSLPALALRPSLRALVLGRIVIARVDVADAVLALTRRADGAWLLGGSEDGAGVALLDLVSAPGAGGRDRRLPRIGLTRTQVTLDDQRAGGRMELANGTMVITPRAGRLDATLSARLHLERAVPPAHGELALQVRAQASAMLTDQGTLAAVDFSVEGDAGQLALARDAGPPFVVAGLEAVGHYHPDVETVRFQRLAAVVGASRLDATATVILRDAPMLALDGTVDALAMPALTRLWPADFAPAVRTWLDESVRVGVLRRCRVQLGLPAIGIGDAPAVTAPVAATPDALDIACDFDGVTAHYLRPLDPIRAAAGSARLTAERFAVNLTAGKVGACQVAAGTLTMNLTVDPPSAVVTAEVNGASADVLALVDRPPLQLVAPLGIAPKDLGGRSRVHAELRLPVRTGLTAADVAVQATAALTAASLPVLVAGIGIKDGELDVRIVGRTIEVSGKTGVTGLPAVTTPVTVALTVGLGARPQDTREVKLALGGDGLVARGTAKLAGTTLTALTVDRLRFARSDLTGTLRRSPAGDYEATLDGPSLDLEALLADPRLAAADPTGFAPAYALTLRLGRVWASRDREIQNLRGSVRAAGGRLGALALTGSLVPGGDFRATRDGREIAVTSDQAGRLLQALGGLDQIVGGRLTLAASTDERGPQAFLAGELSLTDFKVVRAPQLAKILGLASLGGIAALLQGDGLPISEARFPFRWETGRLNLQEVRAIGAIGLTADGVIDRSAGTCDLRGDIIPAYTLNTVLGKVPLIGRLLVGGKGRGVFGIDYRASGKLSDPAVQVNPLTSVAPTVLRSWFVDPFTRGVGGKPPAPRPRTVR